MSAPAPSPALLAVQCASCGAPCLRFPSQIARSRQIFCSVKCRALAHHGVNNPKWRGGPEERCCKECERTFLVRVCPSERERGRHVFCSKRCLYMHNTIPGDPVSKAREYRRRADAKARASTRLLGHHTPVEWANLCAEHAYCCAHCHKFRSLTRDHIIPLSKGGSDLIDNIQPLCRSCNSIKNSGPNHVCIAAEPAPRPVFQ